MRNRVAASAFAVALLVTACSSGSDDTTSNADPGDTIADTGDTAPAPTSELPSPPPDPTSDDGAATDTTDDASPTPVTDAVADPLPVPAALQFEAPLVGGGQIDLAAGFTGRPTVFWFWAPT